MKGPPPSGGPFPSPLAAADRCGGAPANYDRRVAEPEARAVGAGRRRPTLEHVWFAVVTVVPATIMLIPRLSTVDLAYAVRAGELMIRSGSILRTDPFGLTTAGRPWLNQQWASQVLFAAAYRAGGWAGLIVLRATLVWCVSALVFASCRARGASTRWAGIATAASFVVAIGNNLRAELLGLVLFAVAIWILSTRATHPARVWAIPPLIVVWANVHGSFVLAPLLVALALLEDRSSSGRWDRRLAIVGLLGLAATFATPFGAGAWSYALGLSTNPQVRDRVVEWSPTTLRTVIGVLFFGSVAAVTVLLARSRTPPSAATLVSVGIFFLIGAYAIRGVAWWAVAVPPAVAPLFPRAEASPDAEGSPLANRAVVAVLALGLIASLPWWRDGGRPAATLLRIAPGSLTEAYRSVARPDDRVLNSQLVGSWFEFAVPGVRTFVDARIEVPPDRVWADYTTMTAVARGWRTALARWRFDVIVMLRPRDARLANAVRTLPCWREVYSGVDGSVFVRTSGAAGGVECAAS